MTKIVVFCCCFFSPLLTSLPHFLPVADNFTLHTHAHYFEILTQFLRLHILGTSFSVRSRKRPGIQNCPDYIVSFPKISVFYLPLFYSALLPCKSVSTFLFRLNSLQEPAKLHCHVSLTSQLEWTTLTALVI